MNVALNIRVVVAFDIAMTPLTGTVFTLAQGSTAIAGAVSTSSDGRVATFVPNAALAPSTIYTATVTSGARSLAGVALAANHQWIFTTGAAPDTTPPVVTAVNPAANGVGVATNARIVATFSEAMDPASITTTTFTLKQGNTPIAGVVAYGPGLNATFAASSALTNSTLYTAAFTTGVRDLQGNAIAAPYTWSFTTGAAPALGPAPVGLGAAGNYVVLAKTAVTTGAPSVITGDIGLSPAALSYMTGFSETMDGSNVFATSAQVTGRLYAADNAVPTPENLTTAVANMESAYTDAAGRTTPDFNEYQSGNLGGLTLAPGLYTWTSSITMPSAVTISGGANDVWIFQTTGDLGMAADVRITLAGNAQAKNIFWQVAGHTILGARSHFEGILLCKTDVTLQTNATMNGRILSQTAVTLAQATLTKPAQ